jgi:hypothetical protein
MKDRVGTFVNTSYVLGGDGSFYEEIYFLKMVSVDELLEAVVLAAVVDDDEFQVAVVDGEKGSDVVDYSGAFVISGSQDAHSRGLWGACQDAIVCE